MSFVLVCDEIISLDVNGDPSCSSGWGQHVNVAPFSISDIDPQVATAMFGAGFVLFVVPWAAAWGISQILKLLK